MWHLEGCDNHIPLAGATGKRRVRAVGVRPAFLGVWIGRAMNG